MCFAVVDPRLLVRAFEFPFSAPAKLLALFIYGQTCATALGRGIGESDDLDVAASQKRLDPIELAAVRERAERTKNVAERRKELLEDIFEELPPDDLLLVMSAPIRRELVELARETQGNGRWHVHPDKVNRLVARWTVREVVELGPVPRYLGPDRVHRRDYLIHTAVKGEAENLVTEDELLHPLRDASHSDPGSRRSVRPCSLEDFVRSRMEGSRLKFDDIDAPAVFRAATHHLGA